MAGESSREDTANGGLVPLITAPLTPGSFLRGVWTHYRPDHPRCHSRKPVGSLRTWAERRFGLIWPSLRDQHFTRRLLDGYGVTPARGLSWSTVLLAGSQPRRQAGFGH